MNESPKKSRSTPVSPHHTVVGNFSDPFDAEMTKKFAKFKQQRRDAIGGVSEEGQKKMVKELKRFLKGEKEAEKAEMANVIICENVSDY